MVKKKNGSMTLDGLGQAINDLTISTAKGFVDMEKRLVEVHGKIDKSSGEIRFDLGTVRMRLENIERQLDGMYSHERRITRLEKKVGIAAAH